ncbi:MAG: HlyD family efflux transporter periplasmic adaptor subunit, partial [Desulfobacterales bacterium]|nr:HlyD family efflux transporter periplasmic adaptor subunit [Desulfobacterales bacterium]
TELDTEELGYNNNELKIKTAATALDLFIKYEFPKTAEEFTSKYDEGLRGLTQIRRAAVAKLAQSRARLKSAEGRFKIESEQCRELYDQFAKCVIRAERTGLVVYGTDGHMFGGEQIREGATVRERQKIITIPDMKQMAVKVKIHEAFIKKVRKGLPATVKVDAYADELLTGEVSKVGILPDYQNRWMNPDIKVYITTVEIHEVRDWLKPGMSAKVEIMVKQLTNVVYAPLQCISLSKGKPVCYVSKAGGPEQRAVEIGEFNDEFIEIKAGLNEGEIVLLNTPQEEKVEALPEEPIEEPLANGADTNKPVEQAEPARKNGQPETALPPKREIETQTENRPTKRDAGSPTVPRNGARPNRKLPAN